ncbi:MAG: ABC transporter ATP-binding protein, partial [Methanosarcinales archaeon]
KSFGGIKAVNGCSLDVEKCMIAGLIGPNGAGKTTLFNLISGFYKPNSGKIYFKGKRIDRLPTFKIAREGMVRTFQITRALSKMTVLENMMLGPKYQSGENIMNLWLKPKKVKKQEESIKEKALDVLEFFDLLDLKDEYAGALSGGQKKLLELARALMTDPEMLLLDEPFAGVNPTLAMKLLKHIETLRKDKEISFLIIEHDIPMITKISDKIFVMNEGNLIVEGSPEEIKRDKRVLDAYLGG